VSTSILIYLYQIKENFQLVFEFLQF